MNERTVGDLGSIGGVMLKELTPDKIDEIAALANETRAAQDDLLERARLGSAGTGAEGEPGDRIDEELDTPASLAAAGDIGPLPALRRGIDALTPAQRCELLAVMYIGRGEFAADGWHDALERAAQVPEASLTQYVTDETQLHDYLKKYELGVG